MDRTPPASRPPPACPDLAHPLPPQPRGLPRCLGTASAPVSFADLEKKSAHALEQDRPDIRKRRAAWFEGQLDLDPERLVFIDETWASTNMARRYGRAPRGRRLRAGVPHGRWKTITFVAGVGRGGGGGPLAAAGRG